MISINATLVLQMLNFLVLIWVLNRLLFKPIFHVMEEREVTMTESKMRLEKLRTDAEQKSRSFEAKINTARHAAAERSDQSRAGASDRAKAIIREAKNKAREDLNAVRAEAEKQADAVRADLGDYKQALVDAVLHKVMDRKIS